MKIHSFIFTWNEYYTQAEKYNNILYPISNNVTVINSNSNGNIINTYKDWIHLNDAYFTEQWYTAIDIFLKNDCDILFHIQSDGIFNEFNNLFETALYYYKNYNCGIYAPNIDHTSWIYDTPSLNRINNNVYEVPNTDCTCWFIKREIIQQFPKIDITLNKHGWFVDFVMCVLSKNLNMKILRNYDFTVKHKQFTGYNQQQALKEFKLTIEYLGPNMVSKILNMFPQYKKLFIDDHVL